MYGPQLNRDWIGLRVKLWREAQNKLCKIPRGTEGTIAGYAAGSQGITFQGDPCPHCGVSPVIAGMGRRDFDILTPESEWPDTRGKGRRYRK